MPKAKVALKVGQVVKLDEEKAKLLLQTARGSRGGLMSEIMSTIFRRVNSGDKYFLVPILTPEGHPVPKAEASDVAGQINNDFKKTQFKCRVRYVENGQAETGLVVVPVEKYEAIFGKRERVPA